MVFILKYSKLCVKKVRPRTVPKNKIKSVWLNSGLAQALALINGIILTIAAFLVFSYYISDMSQDEYRKKSDEIGSSFVQGIAKLEDSVRVVASLIALSDNSDRTLLAKNIKRNLPNLGNFDQLIWLYEESQGNWKYKVISESSTQNSLKGNYRLVPDTKMILRLVEQNVFKDRAMRVISDFENMNYEEVRKEPLTLARSFAFIQAVEGGNQNLGAVIGVTHAAVLLDQNFIDMSETMVRFTIRDTKKGRRIFHMGSQDEVLSDKSSLVQQYSFFVGDSEWQILMEIAKKKNIALMEKVPYIILFFGFILTLVGTLFIRNNKNQAEKLSRINRMLENKNFELQTEVSERERLNAALAISEKNNRAIIDAVSDVIFEVDIDGNILFLSAAWQNITGFELERSQGKNLFSMLYPEDQGKQRHDFNLLIKGQKPAYRSFTRLRIEDGTFRAIELAISMIRQDENKSLRIVGTITDVEERRRAERALAEAEKKYRTIVENAAGGLYQLTPEGIYLSANPSMAKILKYNSPEEMLRMIKNANGTVYSDLAEREKFIKILKKQEHISGYETQVTCKDNSKIWVRENIRVVQDEQNHVLYFEGSMEDITERKKADLALMEAKIASDMASRAKTEFIANMSHELRTPLNAIIGFSDIMQKEVMGPLGQAVYKDYVSDIHTSGKGLLKIINEILDISKIEAGNRDLNESEFSSQDVLERCMDLYAARVKDKKIIIINEAKDMPVLVAEELSIKQVIGNIYSNAVKFTPANGRITLFTNYDMDGSFRLSITDTGVGMTSTEIKKALSPFGQLDNALDRSGSGTGLGLPLAQAIMRIHDGRLEILSEKSIGTTVTMIFPAVRVVSKGNTKTRSPQHS